MKGTDVSQAYEDVIARFLGEQVPMRFTTYEKPGLLQRIFGVR
jgi:septum site-determining protein MinD